MADVLEHVLAFKGAFVDLRPAKTGHHHLHGVEAYVGEGGVLEAGANHQSAFFDDHFLEVRAEGEDVGEIASADGRGEESGATEVGFAKVDGPQVQEAEVEAAQMQLREIFIFDLGPISKNSCVHR